MRISRQVKTDLAIASVVALAIALLALATRVTPAVEFRSLRSVDIVVLVTMFAIVVAIDTMRTTLPQFRFNTVFTISGTVYFAAAIGYGATVGIFIALLGTLIEEIIARRELRKLIFNVAMIVCATAIAGIVYSVLAGGNVRIPLAAAQTIVAALIASGCYLLTNDILFAYVVGTSIGKPRMKVFMANIEGLLLQNITLPSIGLLLTTVRDLSPLSLVIVLLPLLGPFFAMRGQRQTQLQVLRTIEALADMVDRRDVTTAQHSGRVANYVQQIIDELGNIRFAEAEAIILAARVHDLGKIAIPDAVLLKPGRLDEEEYRLMRYHPVAGDEVLNKLSIYKDSLGVVRHHHERYDGKGYPDGLKGEEIPLGARIVGVADTYDVITSDRPYHRARSVREAKEELINCRGTQFDPVMVDAFIRVLDRMNGPAEASASEPTENLVPVGVRH